MKKSQDNIVKFSYKRKNKRPKRLENDVFVIYTPEKITINPGEKKNINMQLKIFFTKTYSWKLQTITFTFKSKIEIIKFKCNLTRIQSKHRN